MSDDKPKNQGLHFSTKPYTGMKEKLKRDYQQRRSVTQKVEQYLNSLMTESPQTKTVFEIAEATNLSSDVVRKVLSENGHGHNGITF